MNDVKLFLKYKRDKSCFLLREKQVLHQKKNVYTNSIKALKNSIF